MSKLRTDFKDEILQEGETHRVYNIKRKGTDEVVESEVYLEKAYEALQEGDEFGAKDVNEIHGRLNSLASMNLLINSDFKNPVNQRGQTSYTATINIVYSIDRWRITNNATLSINDGSISLEANSTTRAYMLQAFEHSLPEESYTLTVKVKSINGVAFARCQDSEFNNISGDVNLTVGVNKISMNGGINKVGIYCDNGATIELEYIKLEQGSIATPFVPRPYGEELALCQRYCQKIECLGICNNFESGTWYMIGVPFTTSMRINPTIESYSVLDTGFGSENVSISQSYIDTDGVYKIILDSIGEKSMYFFKLLLSAEIY